MASNKKRVTQQMFEDPEAVQEENIQEESVLQEENANVLDLPSKGMLGYPSQVSFRDILVEDEEILSTATQDTYSKTLNRVIKSLLLDPEWFEQMSIHDRDYVLIWLWANNYNPIKELEVTCQSCGNKDTHKFDLRKVDVTEIKDNFVNNMEIPLADGTKVYVRPTTVRDEIFAEEYCAKNEGASYQTILLACSIDVGKVMRFEEKLQWIRKKIKAKEYGYIKNYHSYFKFGVDSTSNFPCSACGEVTRDFIPFQAEDILMPSVPDDFEQLLSANQGVRDQSD